MVACTINGTVAYRVLTAQRGAKVLLICKSQRKVVALETALLEKINLKVGLFHEGLPLVQRDRNAAWFAESDGAQLLICSEIGSEGRNFQFAHHLVLFDLPLNPGLLAQRLGPLDRIGQTQTIRIHVPYVSGSAEECIVEWYHRGLDAFETSLHGGNDYQDKFKAAGLTALLGCGFDPGVTNVYTAYAMKHHFSKIDTLDILDCNAGDHGKAFATNFNPEINIREVTAKGRFWENGAWQETDPISLGTTFDFPGVGPKKMYLLYHEELESLSKNFPSAKRMRFWMTFSDNYLTHLRVLEGIGMTSITPIKFQGQDVIPLEFLKAILPDPGSLGALTKGRTCIGDVITGVKDGQVKHYFIWNECDHEACYAETGAQGVSYTTGVPAMIGAAMLLTGAWKGEGVFNMEELDPDPFMAMLNEQSLPWKVQELSAPLAF